MSFAQTAAASVSTPAPISRQMPSAVLMYAGEAFPYSRGVAVSAEQWEYERRQRALSRTVEIAVDAQLPSVRAPCVCPPVKPARWAWVKPALRGFGAGVLAGALLINLR
jgi:hypothetical protein